jgi:catalase
VGTNYLQLPINAPKTRISTNQRDGQMAFIVDRAPGQNPHVNYEPSSLGGLKEAEPSGKEHEPAYNAKLVRQKLDRTNDFKQAGETYRKFDEQERQELISNLVEALSVCAPVIQQKMIDHFTQADADYGRRVSEGLQHKQKNANPSGSVEAQKGAAMAEQMGKPSDSY